MFLSDAVKAIDGLRATFLFGNETETPVGDEEEKTPIAEQHLLLSLSALEQAKSYMQLADYWRMRGE